MHAYIYIYIYEHEAIQKPISENNIGAPLAPQKSTFPAIRLIAGNSIFHEVNFSSGNSMYTSPNLHHEM